MNPNHTLTSQPMVLLEFRSFCLSQSTHYRLRVVQYTRTESGRLRYASIRLAGSPMARDLENKRITRVMSLQRVGKVGGSSRSETDGHDRSLRKPTRLAGSPMARDLENKRITWKLYSQIARLTLGDNQME